jgi:hypothetical protein
MLIASYNLHVAIPIMAAIMSILVCAVSNGVVKAVTYTYFLPMRAVGGAGSVPAPF